MSLVSRIAGGLLIAAALAACTSSGVAPTSPPTAAASPTAASGAVAVGTATTSLGVVLVGPNGLTLYTHAGDTSTSSSCTGGCAAAWPPLIVAAGQQATAGTGVTGQLATLTRPEGTIQVTYNGLPLYYWQSDTKPGDVTGQGVAAFTVATPGGAGAPNPASIAPPATPAASAPAATSAPATPGYSY